MLNNKISTFTCNILILKYFNIPPEIKNLTTKNSFTLIIRHR